MILRPSALLGSQFAGAEIQSRSVRLCQVQRRWKTFTRRVDRLNQVYYAPTKRADEAQDGEPRLVRELFEMPDLLLDLDAEENPNVRASDDADEARMRERWDVDPRRTAIQAQVRDFEEELFDARRRSASASRLTSIWRLSQQDVVSAALLGSPGNTESRQPDPPPIDDWRGGSGFLERLGVENGIPRHASGNDVLFLEWMMLRHRLVVAQDIPKYRYWSEPIAEALRGQTSIKGIRRLTFQNLFWRQDISLAAYTNFLGFSSDRTPNIPHEIRDACLLVCDAAPDGERERAYAEVLSFLGNLSERFSAHELPLGATLHGLALRISAKAESPAASSVWLQRGYSNNIWMLGDAVCEDIIGALNAYHQSLCNAGTAAGGLNRNDQRQLLFQVLTGLDERGSLSPNSFRTLSTLYLHVKNRTRAEDAYAVYELYIRLLGRLGAVRTLWHEGQAPASWARTKARSWDLPGDVDALLREALASALQVAVVPEEAPADLDLDQCVLLDYHSIGAQKPDGWLRAGEGDAKAAAAAAAEGLGLMGGDLPSPDQPYVEWMVQIRRRLQL